MDAPRSRPWLVAALAVLVVVFAVDMATAPDVAVITLYGIAPLLAGLGSSPRATGAVGALALLGAIVSRLRTDDMEPANAILFIFAVAALAALATGGALIRARRESAAARAGVLAAASEALAGPGDLDARLRAVEVAASAIADRCTITLGAPGATEPDELVAPLLARGEQLGTLRLAAGHELGRDDRALAGELAQRCAAAVDSARLLAEADEAYGMLDAVFERAPVGLGLFDREMRLVRINDHLAEINGMPAAEQIGRPVTELVPDVEGVVERLREVLETGRGLSQVEVAGTTRAAPGVRREFDVSYWPVRRRGDDEILGVGCVVFEVTARREAERALREQTVRYESLLRALSEVGEGMIVLEDERLVYANPAFLAITGYSTEELQALPSMFDLIEEDERENARRRAVMRLDGVSDPAYQLTLRHRNGRRVPLEIAGVPLELGGRTQMVVVGRDVTARAQAQAERERLLERAAFLAEASAAFDAVLDEERILDALARLSVRDLADTCVILLGRSASTIRRVACVARDPADEKTLRELVERYPFADRRSHPLLDVLATGRTRVVVHPDGPELPAQDERHRELMERFNIASSVLVPLRARGRTLGVMALGFADVVGAGHEALLDDLARRAALAIDNARLYEERANVARTLQRSLLPPMLPDVPGLELAARYVAAGEGNEVGGDFYDCFRTGDGQWAVVVGDVCGKGAEAAAVTALARYTVRASATLHSDSPGVVLQDLNDAIRSESSHNRFCTVVYVSLQLHGDRVTGCVASGGHPLPLILRADGRVETTGMPGTLLGILPDPEIRPQELTLRAGDSLILYTDGVIEASPIDHRFGPEQLARCVSECHGRAPVATARHIEDAVLEVQGGQVRDDVAVLVVRVSPQLAAPFVPDEPGVATST